MKFINALHEEYVPTSWLTFDDVLLVPRYSTLKSRNDSKISTKSALFSYDSINIPIISANMDTVTGSEMAIAMNNLGGLGILHRFHKKFDDYKKEIYKVFDECQQVSFSVGIGNDWLDFAKSIKKELENKTNSYHQVSVCLDVAHGHMEQSVEMVKMLHDELDPFFIIAGNIATPSGALALAEAGAHSIKVGIGSGSVCTTRIVTGHGVPQLSAIMNVARVLYKNYPNVSIIADGGIRNSGDILKAIAAGADSVMLGRMLAGCKESPKKDNKHIYRGQSSRHFMNDISKKGVAAEGEAILVPEKGSVKDVIEEIVGGIRSGLTYSGCEDLYQFSQEAEFIEISHHGWLESKPHALSDPSHKELV